MAAHDKKTQGELIEQWAQAAYAWRCFSGKVITITKPMRTSARRTIMKALDFEEKRFFDMFDKYDRLPLYAKPYYFIRRAWESWSIFAARAALYLKSRLVRLYRNKKST